MPSEVDNAIQDDGARARRIKRIILATAFLGPVLAFTVFYLWARANVEASIKAEFKRIRSEGFPTTHEELSEWPTVAPGENAAPTYRGAFALKFDDYGEDFDQVPGKGLNAPKLKPGAPLPDECLKQIRQLLHENSAAIQKLLEATEFPKCKFSMRFTKPGPLSDPPFVPELWYDHGADAQDSVRILSLAALTESHDGNGDRAATLLAAAGHLIHSLKNDHSLMSELVRQAQVSILSNELPLSVTFTQFPEDGLVRIKDRFEQLDLTQGFKDSFIGDRVYCEDDWKVLQGESDKSVKEHYCLEGWDARIPRLWILADFKGWLRMQETLVSYRHLPIDEWKQQMTALTKEVENLPSHRIITHLHFGPYDRALEVLKQVETQKDIFLAVVAIERFRVVNTRLPANFEELAPDFLTYVPVDRYTGKPLIYQKKKVGYIVYSTGVNEQDDNGDLTYQAGKPVDIGMRIKR
ncbi:MAG: hypothetical protein QF473_23825 [Planctomycetota bacterium]|nr:hypothetical protein [Planctomycetota bacterium]